MSDDEHGGWFGAGWAVYLGTPTEECSTEFYPPMDDWQAQQEWLAGFGSAWAEYPPGGNQGPEFWLSVALKTRPELLQQLRLHHSRVSQRVH